MKFDGKAFAKSIEQQVAAQVTARGIKPKIVSVLVGSDPASVLYTNLKSAAAQRCGIGFEVVNIDPVKLSEESLFKQVVEVSSRADVTGVMVQLPIPGLSREEQERVITAIPNDKDVDGLVWERSKVLPATVAAILLVMDEIRVKTEKVVVVGAAGAIGRPLVIELKKKGTQVVEIERRTANPAQLIAQGEVIVSCVGKPGLITEEQVKAGAIVIDVGMSEIEGGKVVGDMTREVYQKASVSVEVPGGVGPVTIACLMQNAIVLYGY